MSDKIHKYMLSSLIPEEDSNNRYLIYGEFDNENDLIDFLKKNDDKEYVLLDTDLKKQCIISGQKIKERELELLKENTVCN